MPRVEDGRLTQGRGQFVDDIRLPGVLHAMFLRSPHAHARIVSIDVARAKAVPGVASIFTGNDIAEGVGPVPCACAGAIQGLKVPYHSVLAKKKVIFVGQALAVVIAESIYAAADALDLIEVAYDVLPPVVEIETAAESQTVIHPEFGSNVAFVYNCGTGDVDAAFAKAACIVRQKIVHPRLAPAAIEPRVVMAGGAGSQLTIWSSTQIPHILRTHLAQMLRLPEACINVVAPDVGGGFGSKLNVYAEEAVVGYAALQLQRPVKWAESRRENLSATIHGRAQTGVIELAAATDGTILGARYTVTADLGAYCQLLTPAIFTATGLMLSGAYKIPAIHMQCTGVYTNKMATDAYRGAGRPEASYVIERAIDLLGKKLNQDPAAIRQKNFIPPTDFPFPTATGVIYDSGNYRVALDRALKKVSYQRFRQQQRRARANGKLVGIGISSYVEISSVGPSAAVPFGGWETATVRVNRNGGVTVWSGILPHGQGEATSFTQIVADRLGISPSDIEVKFGDTSQITSGIGTFGSRGISVGGAALVDALEQLVAKAKPIAATLLSCNSSRVKLISGKFVVRGKRVSWSEVAEAAHPHQAAGLCAEGKFDPSNFTFPFGTHVCVAEVERETGEVHILRYVAVDDCGRVINPLLVDGQIHGGIAQGFGQAMLEEITYNEDGQLVTGTFMDYALPRAAQLPQYETSMTKTLTDVNPLGAKGVGESGAIGATPALVNAVIDALSPFGVDHIDMPLKPEKLWRAMQGAPMGTGYQNYDSAI
jgi:carbon-monoxide dehydrogenase large subunit